MKYLLLLLIVVAVLWLMRLGRSSAPNPKTPGAAAPSPAQPPVQQVVACAHCGVHLPIGDAVTGRAGRLYCSEAHRQLQDPEGQA